MPCMFYLSFQAEVFEYHVSAVHESEKAAIITNTSAPPDISAYPSG